VVTPGSSGGNGTASASKTPNGYTYLGSADSPKTGDMTPIAVIAAVMVISGAGIVVLGRKQKKG
jgi:LPXTG-motif cell wall-anchored protein